MAEIPVSDPDSTRHEWLGQHLRMSDLDEGRTSNPFLANTRLSIFDRPDPNNTIVLNRLPKIPADPLVASEAQSEYEPAEESDSDREPKSQTKTWELASQLRKRKMPITKRPKLREIRYLDGDIQLQQVPQHLLQALEQNCRTTYSNLPTCTRSLGASSINFVDNREAFFRVKSTCEKLFQARFRYGKDQQITVVKERFGKEINGGRAVIVTGIPGGSETFTSPEGIVYTEVRFKTWSPNILTRHTPACSTDIVRLIRAKSNDVSADQKAAPTVLPHQPHNPTSQAQNPDIGRSSDVDWKTGSIEDKDIVMAEDSDGSDVNVPLSVRRRHAMQDSASQTHIVTAKMPVLDNQTPNQQSRAQVSGISPMLDTPITNRTPKYSASLSTPTRTIPAMPSFTPSSNISTSPRLSAHCPTFVFRANKDSGALRSKSAVICSSVEKLFAQANIAGIINSHSLILHLSATADERFFETRVIRGDPEDLGVFMTRLNVYENVEITVLPGEE